MTADPTSITAEAAALAVELVASVVVPVFADRRVHRLLDSLAGQTLPPDRFEVIVVENGSTVLDDVAARPGVRLLRLPSACPPAARNAGLRAACGRWVLMTDADCVAAPDWVERMVGALNAAGGTVGAIGGRIDKYRPAGLVQRCGMTIVDGQRTVNYLPALPLPYVVTASAGYPRDALMSVGGFDEHLVSGSDVDTCYRLGLAGRTVAVTPRAVVFHDDRASLAAHFQRFARYARYQVLLFKFYRGESGKRWLINTYPWLRVGRAVIGLPRAAAGLARGRPERAAELGLAVVEASGVWWGDLCGSVRHRQVYL